MLLKRRCAVLYGIRLYELIGTGCCDHEDYQTETGDIHLDTVTVCPIVLKLETDT